MRIINLLNYFSTNANGPLIHIIQITQSILDITQHVLEIVFPALGGEVGRRISFNYGVHRRRIDFLAMSSIERRHLERWVEDLSTYVRENESRDDRWHQ